MVKIASPNQQLEVRIDYQRSGINCTVLLQGNEVLCGKSLGLTTDIGEFPRDCSGEPEVSCVEIHESYSLPGGKTSVYEGNANEVTLAFHGETEFQFILRVYDDGIAFRYGLQGPAGRSVRIPCESTTFCLPDGFDKLWAQDWIESYEGLYNPLTWQEIAGRRIAFPCLFHKADGPWVLLSEANVYNAGGSYCASHLVGQAEHELSIHFAPEQTEPVLAALPFVTPWRAAIVVQSNQELAASTLICNLNPGSAIQDESWIKPSRNIWGWWFFDTGAQLYTEQLRYVDFAADMGFESVTVDASWDASWIGDLCAYAKRKGVSVWIWTTKEDVGTLEKAEALFSLWESWGVAGVKVDFYINDSQYTMGQYHRIAMISAKHRLMLNNHGCVRPGGEQRTYPHMLTFEGIMGLEHYKWSGFPNAQHHCTAPFTRNVVGPMDYTVVGFSNPNRNTTMGHQLALSIVFDSACQHYAESIYHLAVWRGTDFLRRTPAKFDGMRLLSGYPGDHVAMMRYKGDAYYLGVITKPSQSLDLSLGFLGQGTYQCEIYHDSTQGDEILVETRLVCAADVLELSLLESGGAAVYIARRLQALHQLNAAGYMAPPLQCVDAAQMTFTDGNAVAISIDGHTAMRIDTGVRFRLQPPSPGRYTVRLTYASQAAVEIELHCMGHVKPVLLPATGGERICRWMDIDMTIGAGTADVELRARTPHMLWLREAALVANAQPAGIRYPIDLAEVSGTARKAVGPHGEQPLRVTGIGASGSLIFRHICLETSGEYLLRIHYYSGATLPLLVTLNEETSQETSLLDSSGEAVPRWDVPCAKEIKVRLRTGENTLRFDHPDSDAVHIAAITLTPAFV